MEMIVRCHLLLIPKLAGSLIVGSSLQEESLPDPYDDQEFCEEITLVSY